MGEEGTITQLKGVCSDVKSPTTTMARVFFTAKKAGLSTHYSSNKCNLHLGLSRNFALKLAAKALTLKK